MASNRLVTGQALSTSGTHEVSVHVIEQVLTLCNLVTSPTEDGHTEGRHDVVRRHIHGDFPESGQTRSRNTGHIENLLSTISNGDVVDSGRALLHHEVSNGSGDDVDQVGVTGDNTVRELVLASCRVHTQGNTNHNRENGSHQQQAGRNPHALAKFLVNVRAVGATAPIELGDHIGQPLNVAVPGVHFGIETQGCEVTVHLLGARLRNLFLLQEGRLQGSNRCKVTHRGRNKDHDEVRQRSLEDVPKHGTVPLLV